MTCAICGEPASDTRERLGTASDYGPRDVLLSYKCRAVQPRGESLVAPDPASICDNCWTYLSDELRHAFDQALEFLRG